MRKEQSENCFSELQNKLSDDDEAKDALEAEINQLKEQLKLLKANDIEFIDEDESDG